MARSRPAHVPGKVYVYAYLLVASLKSVPIILGSRRGMRNRLTSVCLNGNTVTTALFPALLPSLYKSLSSDSSIFRPELLSSPAILLLPRGLRLQVTLYAIGAALQSSVRSSRIRSFFPPTWWLNVVFNAFLIHVFLFDQSLFPKAYRKILLVHPNYIPPSWSEDELSDFLSKQNEWPLIDDLHTPQNGYAPGHKYVLCASLHPEEPSCLKNYLEGWIYELRTVTKWVSMFTALSTLYSRPRHIMQRPGHVLAQWVVSTAKMSIFVAGSINTSWAMTCPLQRILPPKMIPRTRFLINGLIGSLWILVLPEKRREQVSLWVARMGTLVAWDMWVKGGGYSIRYAEVILLALSWMRLSDLRRKGVEVDGLVGLALKYLDDS